MLVLTRKRDESVVIDGGIVVTVVGIENGKVRLGFTAPPKTGIRRAELPPIVDMVDRGNDARRHLSPEEIKAMRAERVERITKAREEGQSLRDIVKNAE